VKKLLLCIFFLSLLFISCSDSSTGPNNSIDFFRDYYLIVVHNDSLLQYLPDTIARIDSAIAFDIVMGVDPIFDTYDTADFNEIIEEKEFILKEDLGIGSDEGGVFEVINPGEKLFAFNYPDDIAPSWFGAPAIEIYVSSFDPNYYFNRDLVKTHFLSFDSSFNIDSTSRFGIPSLLFKVGNKIEIKSAGYRYF
jgi:hypothetical protein